MPDSLRSALVVLRPGRPTSDRQRPAEVPPPDRVVQQVTGAFAAQGFQVGPCIGISFSITAEKETFERAFGVDPQSTQFGGLELPLDHVGADVVPFIDAVTLTEPPAFGPGNP